MNQVDRDDKFTVVFHNAEPSDAVWTRANYFLAKLARAYPGIMRGSMVIEGRHRHHHQGNLYHVSLRLHLPNGDVMVSHDPERNHAHEDVYVSMRDACDAARKQLDAVTEQRNGKGARHAYKRFSNRPEAEEGVFE
jgi:hypothetical protein